MRKSTLSVIVPTMGRPTLGRLLDSIGPGHEVIVVGDAAHDLTGVQQLVEGHGFTYLEREGPCRAGQLLRDYAITKAQGDYLVFNDDTDVFTENALDLISAQLPKDPVPLLFRAVMPWGQTLWGDTPSVREGEVDGHQFVTPNIPGKIGFWGTHAHGDYAFISSTLDLWRGRYEARTDVIARCYLPATGAKGVSRDP